MPGFVGLHGVYGIELAEVVRFKLDAELLCNVLDILRRIHADGEDDHVELFLFDPFVGGGVP